MRHHLLIHLRFRLKPELKDLATILYEGRGEFGKYHIYLLEFRTAEERKTFSSRAKSEGGVCYWIEPIGKS